MRWWGRFERQSMSPKMARAAMRLDTRARHSRRRAQHQCSHARHPSHATRYSPLKELAGSRSTSPARASSSCAGDDHWPWTANADDIVDEVEEFLTGERHELEPDRMLATVLFTDIVGSTERGRGAGRQALAGAARTPPCDRRGASSTAIVGGRWIQPATGSSPRSTGRQGRSAAPRRSQRPCGRWGSRSAPGCTPASVRSMGGDVGGIAVHIGARVVGGGRPRRGAGLEHGQGSRGGLGLRVRGPRHPRAEGGPRRVAPLRRR